MTHCFYRLILMLLLFGRFIFIFLFFLCTLKWLIDNPYFILSSTHLGGSATSSPAVLGIRGHRLNQRRTQSSMQLHNYYGDANRNSQYTGEQVLCSVLNRQKPTFLVCTLYSILKKKGFCNVPLKCVRIFCPWNYFSTGVAKSVQ